MSDKPGMADYAPGQPMEEILASIKRIIAEDAPVGARVEALEAPPEPIEDVLELGEPETPPPVSPPVTPAPDGEPLVSSAAEAASRNAFAALATVSIDPRAAPNSLDGLVRELLKPMLKDWLDANLPGVVERLVAREIARLGPR